MKSDMIYSLFTINNVIMLFVKIIFIFYFLSL